MSYTTVAPSVPLCYSPHLTSKSAPSGIFSSIKRKVLSGSQTQHIAYYAQQQDQRIIEQKKMGHKHSKQASQGISPRSTSRHLSTTMYPQQGATQKGGDVPPPAYSAAPNAAPNTAVSIVNSEVDDPYAFLTSFDTVFLIDDSGSMAGKSWRETKDALETIIPVCVQHDADGIDIHFLNARDSPYHHNVTSPATVREIFSSVQPRGATPTGQRLNALLKPYLRRCEQNLDAVKPMNLIVITDGVPTDDVESAIINAAKKLDKLDAPAWQIGIQFFQVGNDEGAKVHLKQLDDELSEIAGGEVRDMVDTVPFKSNAGAALTGEGILKVVLGAVNRRLDRKKSKDLHR